MTPAQQLALEGLVGRGLTAEEVAAIDPLLPNRNDVQIAQVLSQNKTKLQTKYIGTGTILEDMMGKGGDFMDALVAVGETNRDAYWAMDLIKLGRFDIGSPSSQAQMATLAQVYPQFAEGLAKLMARGKVADPIDYNTVSDALNKAEGRMTL